MLGIAYNSRLKLVGGRSVSFFRCLRRARRAFFLVAQDHALSPLSQLKALKKAALWERFFGVFSLCLRLFLCFGGGLFGGSLFAQGGTFMLAFASLAS